MADKKLYIYGAGGHAKVVANAARLNGYEIAGFWEDSGEKCGTDFFGSKLISFQDIPIGANIFIAFGDNRLREAKGRVLAEKFRIVNIIHPSAQVASEVELGQGVYIAALSNIDPYCKLEDFCIVNNNANISHDTILHCGCHICGGGMLSGNCEVGSRVLFGIGSTMIEQCKIGNDTIIGAGSAVIKDIPANVMAAGVPAKVIKKIENK